MDAAATLLDVQRKADRLAADLSQSLADLNPQGQWQALADALRVAVNAAESLKTAAERAACEETHDQS